MQSIKIKYIRHNQKDNIKSQFNIFCNIIFVREDLVKRYSKNRSDPYLILKIKTNNLKNTKIKIFHSIN